MPRRHGLAAPICFLFAILLNVGASAQTLYPNGSSGYSNNSGNPTPPTKPPNAPPNILFIIMDDVGIDQMSIFGYGGGTAPATPNINAIAQAGVLFRNVWAMPECSPSRAIFFEGRYPLRTNIFSAILSNDLANSQVSPFEVTTPEVLHTVNYKSALFGKFHLAGPSNNEFTNTTPHVLGWDYFDGFLEGAPYPIDTTLGGQPNTTDTMGNPLYTCGFVPNTTESTNGADTGACVQPNESCTQLTRGPALQTPGFACLQQGGIFVPNQTCATAVTQPLLFSNDNAYYVWNHVVNNTNGSVFTETARGYVSENTWKSAANWIKQQNNPWMTTVSFANDHTPYQQPPRSLLSNEPDTLGLACTGDNLGNVAATRILSNQMIEAMDTEIGDLFVSTGLATRNTDGSLNYQPQNTNTMVIIIGDNGTYAPGVKAPFDPTRSKGFVYQTGVWVPLIIAGPLVNSPNRQVTSMVNVADLFQLFGEIAGVDVHKVVPSSHILDSQSMLPYLIHPNQPSIRTTNFTQTASNLHVGTPPPCVLVTGGTNTCIQLFNVKAICNFEGGQWYGPDPDGGTQYNSCCDVARGAYSGLQLDIYPISQEATRDDKFKLVRKDVQICGASDAEDTTQTQNEFYRINEDETNPAIDKEGSARCEGTACPTGLTFAEIDAYNDLTNSMNATLASEPPCPGDGNEDKVVDANDVSAWLYFRTNGVGQPPNTSSWYDFNLDGKTNLLDLGTIFQHFGTNCLQNNGGNGNGNNNGGNGNSNAGNAQH